MLKVMRIEDIKKAVYGNLQIQTALWMPILQQKYFWKAKKKDGHYTQGRMEAVHVEANDPSLKLKE